MRKYWAYWWNTILGTSVYRGGLFLWLIGNLMNLVTFTALWLSTNSSQIGTYSRPEIISYYIFATLLWWIVGWHCFWQVREAIRDGTISTKALIKPSSYYWQMFFSELGWHTIGIPIGLLTSTLLIYMLRDYVAIPSFIDNFFPLILALVLSTLLIFSLNLVLALFTFWFTETQSFPHFIWAGLTFLGGQGIPISFIPGIWHTLVIYMPFRYMASFPLEILFGQIHSSEIVGGFIIGIIWLAIFSLAYRLLWREGTKAYSAYGG